MSHETLVETAFHSATKGTATSVTTNQSARHVPGMVIGVASLEMSVGGSDGRGHRYSQGSGHEWPWRTSEGTRITFYL